MEWTIRSILNPVITRLLVYGVNPIDLEYVLTRVEGKNHINSRSLEKSWFEEWEKKAEKYESLGKSAEIHGNYLSAREYFFHAAQCWYAVFLINLSGISEKKRVYGMYRDCYRKSVQYLETKVECIELSFQDKNLFCYLHHPKKSNNLKSPCVIIYSGLGSCKEEMHTLAMPLVERGIAVFIADMPGNGESLLMGDIKCTANNLSSAFSLIPDYLDKRDDIKNRAYGAYGLCMGGGYAYKASSMDSRHSSCVTLFPLFITQVDKNITPQWMKKGEWYDFQTGGKAADEFLNEMSILAQGTINCPYLFVHGKHDNWMTFEKAEKLYEMAQGVKEQIIIEEEPVFSNSQVVTHTMPVGEQIHWIKHTAADWMLRYI
ncbi:MAG TPA: alpha/beta hydrolase [Pseudobacteroides sp.]|uniref:alpha/beta hydrolase n=1 Tax=Pseudobacteroides sp. TaxID=1968840 RepID=UPI002F95E915